MGTRSSKTHKSAPQHVEANSADDAATYTTDIAALAKGLPAISAQARAYYHQAISDEAAIAWGQSHESGAVLDELVRVARVARPAILEGKMKGYGPLRLAYALSVGADLAEKLAAHDAAVTAAAGASTGSKVTLKGSRGARREAIRVLKNLAGRDAAARERIRKAADDSERADERSRSLKALADELEHLRGQVPEDVAADAGATAKLVATLRTRAAGVESARSTAHGDRTAVSSSFDELNRLDGHVLEEIRLLVGAAKDARVGDPSLPAVKSRLAVRPKGKKGKAAGATGATPPATGATAASPVATAKGPSGS